MIRTILFPTDFSPLADNSFRYALSFAKEFDAEIVMLNAYHFTSAESRFAPVDLLEDLHGERQENTFINFEKYLKMADNEGFGRLSLTPLVKDGFADEMILEASKQIKPSLIIMGSKGSKDIAGRIFGSVTLAVARESKVPVLIIPATATYTGLNHIAYAADFKEDNLLYEDYLSRLSDFLKAHLFFAHVYRKEVILDNKDKAAEARLIDTARSHPRQSYHKLSGESTESGLDKFVQQEKINWLVLMPRRLPFFQEIFHKSLSRSLVRHLSIPLLILPNRAID